MIVFTSIIVAIVEGQNFGVTHSTIVYNVVLGLFVLIPMQWHIFFKINFLKLKCWASPVAQRVKNLPALQETQEMWVQSLSQKDL